MIRMISLAMAGALLALSPAESAAETKIAKKLTPQAELTNFTMNVVKCKMAKKPCLTIKMTVKNITDSPKRYVARIVLPESGKGVGGLIPRKGKPAVVKPGAEATVTYPMFHYEVPKAVEIELDVMK
jgi:hypothetical protein